MSALEICVLMIENSSIYQETAVPFALWDWCPTVANSRLSQNALWVVNLLHSDDGLYIYMYL